MVDSLWAKPDLLLKLQEARGTAAAVFAADCPVND